MPANGGGNYCKDLVLPLVSNHDVLKTPPFFRGASASTRHEISTADSLRTQTYLLLGLSVRLSLGKTKRAFSSPEPTILLACGRERELWEAQGFWAGPTPEVRDSRTSRQIWQIRLAENTKRIVSGDENAKREESNLVSRGRDPFG